MPIDTCKTVLQVDGTVGFKTLVEKVYKGDIGVLYTGAIATILTTMTAYYPWFIVHDLMDKYLALRKSTIGLLLRSSVIGIYFIIQVLV